MPAALGTTLLAVLAAVALGCGKEPVSPKKTTIELKSVPPDIMKIAKEKLPDVTFTDAYRKEDGMIEVRGKEKTGKIREIGIKPDGTVAEIE